MSLSVYDSSVGVFTRLLVNLEKILDKAVAWADEKKIDHSALLLARLAPDMFTLTRQIQIATDMAKGTAARLAGVEPPSYKDDESSFAELKARVAKTREFLATLQPAQFEGAESRQVKLVLGPPGRQVTLEFVGRDYLLNFGTPNVYFHYSMVYALLRHNGLAVGKQDYTGS
jgi:uncharacterized protein